MYLCFWRPIALKPAQSLGVGRKCALELSNSGLPLVKEIMKLHGGSVSLESTPDIGTCVTLWFPVAAQGTAATRSGLAAP